MVDERKNNINGRIGLSNRISSPSFTKNYQNNSVHCDKWWSVLHKKDWINILKNCSYRIIFLIIITTNQKIAKYYYKSAGGKMLNSIFDANRQEMEEPEEIILNRLALYRVQNMNDYALYGAMEDVVMQHLGYMDVTEDIASEENHISRWERRRVLRRELNQIEIKNRLLIIMMANNAHLDSIPENRKAKFYSDYLNIVKGNAIQSHNRLERVFRF